MTRLAALLASSIMLGFVLPSLANEPAAAPEATRIRQGPTEQEVIKRTLDLLEVTNTAGAHLTATTIPEPEKLIPNVPIEPIWRVKVVGIPSRFRMERIIRTNRFIKSWEMDFSQRSGYLMRLKTEWLDDLPGTHFPSIDSYQAQMTGTEPAFTGLPPQAPGTKLLDVLGDPMASVWNAKQVVVFYVLGWFPMTRTKLPPKPLWIVHVAGIPHLTLSRRPGMSQAQLDKAAKAEEALTYRRIVIDAATGYSILSDGIPGP